MRLKCNSPRAWTSLCGAGVGRNEVLAKTVRPMTAPLSRDWLRCRALLAPILETKLCGRGGRSSKRHRYPLSAKCAPQQEFALQQDRPNSHYHPGVHEGD